jgi:hypothetical protein
LPCLSLSLALRISMQTGLSIATLQQCTTVWRLVSSWTRPRTSSTTSKPYTGC